MKQEDINKVLAHLDDHMDPDVRPRVHDCWVTAETVFGKDRHFTVVTEKQYPSDIRARLVIYYPAGDDPGAYFK